MSTWMDAARGSSAGGRAARARVLQNVICQPGGASAQGQQHAFRQQLPHNPQLACAERYANAISRRRTVARASSIFGGIGARDEQHKTHRTQQYEHAVCTFRTPVLLQRFTMADQSLFESGYCFRDSRRCQSFPPAPGQASRHRAAGRQHPGKCAPRAAAKEVPKGNGSQYILLGALN